MKKALSFAVALGLVAGVATVASAAELIVNGDARLRGVYSQNTNDIDGPTDHFTGAPGDTPAEQGQDTVQRMDQRYRLNVDVKINDDVKVNTRLVLSNNDAFGAAADTALTHVVDRANMVIKSLGGTLTLGRQDASWGNKFMGWGASVDRIKYTTKVGDMTLGGYLQKNVEGNNAFGDGDSDTWGALAIGKAGDTTWGVLLNYAKLDTNAAKLSGKDTGYLIDPFFTTKVGPASVMGELVYKGGDSMENQDGDPMYGGFVGASVDMAPVTFKGLMAYYKNNEGAAPGGASRDCDNDFAPTLLIGSCNETAIIDFGGTTNPSGLKAEADDSTYLIAAGVDFKANDKLTLGAGIAYLMASEYYGNNGNEDGTLFEIDLTAKYALAKNASYRIGVAYGMVDGFSEKDDNIFVIGNAVEVTW